MTTIRKNVYFNDLDYIVKKYNNTVHSSLKKKPKDVTNISSILKKQIKVLNLK